MPLPRLRSPFPHLPSRRIRASAAILIAATAAAAVIALASAGDGPAPSAPPAAALREAAALAAPPAPDAVEDDAGAPAECRQVALAACTNTGPPAAEAPPDADPAPAPSQPQAAAARPEASPPPAGRASPPAPSPTATPATLPGPPPSADRLIIAGVSIDAAVVSKTVGRDGVMPSPDGTDEVLLYNFASLPGFGGAPGRGGNAVFAGHVDSGAKPCRYGTLPPPCPAVLWDLSKLRIGDLIEVQFAGVRYRYSVRSTQLLPSKGPWEKVVAATPEESLTIMTCAGDFNRQTHTYDQRQVVKAARLRG